MFGSNEYINHILNIGISADTPPQLAQRVRASQLITLVWTVPTAFYFMVFYLLGAAVFAQCLAVVLATHFLVFFLAGKKCWLLTRTLEIIVPASCITVGAVFDFAPDSKVSQLFYVYMAALSTLPFIFFGNNEKRPRFFCLFWVLACAASFYFFSPKLGINASETLAASKIFFALAALGGFGLTISPAMIYQAMQQRMYSAIESLAAGADNAKKRIMEVSASEQKAKAALDKCRRQVAISYSYAGQIQATVFPAGGIYGSGISESFVLAMPRDSISGDFIWHSSAGEHTVICVGDCAGPGLSGSLGSMVAAAALVSIKHRIGSISASEIMHTIETMMQTVLLKPGGSSMRLGFMSVSCLAIDSGKMQASFAGYRSSALMVRNRTLTEIKWPRRWADRPAESIISLRKNDCLYLFTDGYASQICPDTKKKLKRRRLKEFIVSNYSEGMEQQRAGLELLFNSWKGSYEQIDDATVAGIRIS
jgi:serine phosphatase RsbU (regulator of sigma subunit)